MDLQVECPGFAPCHSAYDLCISDGAMPHSDALTYCEINSMLKDGVRTLNDLKNYYAVFNVDLSKS